MDVRTAILSRRSVKPEKMRPDPIDRAILDELFEAANWAPSHGMTEPWRFTVFTGDARNDLLDAVVTALRTDDDEAIASDDPRRVQLRAKFLTPPVVVAIVCTPSTLPNIAEHEEWISVGIAVEHVQLVARAHGIASYWSSGKKAFHAHIAEFLGLKTPSRCLGFLHLGYPKEAWPTGTRRPIADKVTWRNR